MKLFTREELLLVARTRPEALVDLVLVLQERLVQLEERVKDLKAQLARNSQNSNHHFMVALLNEPYRSIAVAFLEFELSADGLQLTKF